jgi:hypothetical protein
MAKGRVRSRRVLREEYDAAAAREAEKAKAKGQAEGEVTAEDDESAKIAKPKKKKSAAAPKEAKPKRTRAAKVVRQKVVWVVFDNSNKKIQSFEYAKRKEADDLVVKLMTDKKTTFFVQPVKEPMED